MATKETKKPGAPAPEPQIDWSQDQQAGFENVSQNDLGIPFLGIIQSGSPQFDRTKPKYADKKIEGCQPGDIFNTLTKTILKAPVMFIPCGYQKLFVEWKSRDTGGGMVKVHRDEAILLECSKNAKNQDVLKNGNIIATTAYFYGLVEQDGEWKQVVVGMTSTALKAASGWLNMMMALKMQNAQGVRFTPPMFSHKYRLSTTLEQKNDNAWFNWQIAMGGPVTEPKLVEEGRTIAKLVAQGRQLALPNAEQQPVSNEDVPV